MSELNLVPAIKAIEEQVNEMENKFQREIMPYRDSLAQLRKLNTVCEHCSGKGKVLRPRACSEDYRPDPDDPTDWIPCVQCKGTGKNQMRRSIGLKVLSICGGLETGLLALKELGIPIDEYHTYEIYEPAIELTKRHFPEVVHHGDVIGADFSQFKGFDLVIAGTCCQSLSVVRQENDNICSGLKGKSAIFFEYARAVKEIQPRWYMLENVVPKHKEDENMITAKLGGGANLF